MSESNGGGDAPEPVDPGSPRALPPHLDPRGRRSLPPRPAIVRSAAAEVLPAPPRRRRRARRILAWTAAVTSVLILVAAVGGYAFIEKLDGQIERIDVFAGVSGNKPAAAPKDAKNILIVGSDTREGLAAGEGTQGRGKTFVGGQRSDTVILAHLYGDSDKAQLVSFPRDSYVTIPAHTRVDGRQVPAREAKLNSAFSDGGPALLIETIQGLTDLRVDNYMQIDFEGFQAMVEALDGVEVCLSEPAKEPLSGIDLKAGRQTIKGEQALAFVRQRYQLPRGDLSRIERQQQFIGAIVRKTLSAGTLLNVRKLNEVLNVATASVRVDENLTGNDLRKLAVRFSKFDAGGVIFSTVPVAGDDKKNGESVVLLDKPRMAALFASLKRDLPPETPEPESATTPANPLTVKPSAIQVRVFNSSGVSGLGRRAYDDLAEEGFQLTGSPGNRGPAGDSTVVRHSRAQAEAARTVVASIPGATTQLDLSLTRTIEVVVGSGYSGTVPVEVVPPAPSAAPAPDAPPPVVTAADDPCAP